jgi:hypothetical protein
MAIVLDGTGSITGLTSGAGIAAAALSGQVPDANAPSGSVIQVVSVAKVDAFTTTSTTPVDVTGLSVSITPSSAASKVLVLMSFFGGGTESTGLFANLVRNSTALNVGTSGSPFNITASFYLGSNATYTGVPIMFLDTPDTTAATTYKLQIFSGADGNSVAVNRRVSDTAIGMSSTITLMEIAA